MRPYPFDPATAPSATPLRGYEPSVPVQPIDAPPQDFDAVDPFVAPPAPYRGSRWRWPMRIAGGGIVLFVLAVVWLAFTAPLSKSLEPLTPPSITLLAEDNTPIARRGAIIGQPVDAAKLPANVTNAFLAIEDRRFKTHWGVDPRGIARAFWHNITSSGRSQGGSTITQQLAKNAFLDSDRTAARKIREVMIAFWLEAWLSKDQILSRYLSNVYFG
ncbi:MAG: transglycosylase domain-containing protein, partial [Pseudomonadota bacterium]|nr:transglycosylase domain-containing protein [Pseudomonadota bacterium]